MSAGAAGLWVISHVSRKRCQSETPEGHLWTSLRVLTQSPAPLLLQVHGYADFEPAVLSSQSGIVSFFSACVGSSPCFILLRPSQKIQHATQIPWRASWPCNPQIPFPLDASDCVLSIPVATPKHLYSVFVYISYHTFDFSVS